MSLLGTRVLRARSMTSSERCCVTSRRRQMAPSATESHAPATPQVVTQSEVHVAPLTTHATMVKNYRVDVPVEFPITQSSTG